MGPATPLKPPPRVVTEWYWDAEPLSLLDPVETIRPVQGPVTALCECPSITYPGAIVKLPNELLLVIFRHYLYTSPQGWPTLTHVCGGWRQVILTTPTGLRLRLYCTYGTPVLTNIDFWPSFPLVVSYGGSPILNDPAPEDNENIIAALKQSGRVGSISLTITNSLLKNLSTISEPFPILEELILLSRENVQVTPPSAFRWGPRLRTLHLTSFPLPSLLQHLSPSTSLVDLRLHEIRSVVDFLPDAFANALSELAQLEALSLHFRTLPSRRTFVGLPPHPSSLIALPALKSLKYRGTSKYLDSLVARIDAPRLGDIGITFFGQPTMDASHLGRFIERIETLTSLDRADVQTSTRAISICCSTPGALTQVKLQISCEQLDWQLDSLTQICDQFSGFLLRVQDLGISSTQSTSEKADVDSQQWRDLLHAFGGAKDFRLSSEHATDILWALFSADDAHTTSTTVLPALCNLRIQTRILVSELLSEAKQSFVTSRRLSGRPVEFHTLECRSYSCRWPGCPVPVRSDQVGRLGGFCCDTQMW
ncbi:hypothetical protein V8E53_005996 [Lactarius tabidus]